MSACRAAAKARLAIRHHRRNNGEDKLRMTTMRRPGLAWCMTAALLALAPSVARAQENCRNTADFNHWLAEFKREAVAKGISQGALNAAAPYLVLDQRIINIDRGQRF